MIVGWLRCVCVFFSRVFVRFFFSRVVVVVVVVVVVFFISFAYFFFSWLPGEEEVCSSLRGSVILYLGKGRRER